MQKGEFYTSGVIQAMLAEGEQFDHVSVENRSFFSLGTPAQVREYERPYLFDLDGTLVRTDHVYARVWQEILKRYDVAVDDNFFAFFVRGRDDLKFLSALVPGITREEVSAITAIKDDLFVRYLDEHDGDVLVGGALEFVRKNSNRRMCIVTSSNSKAAEHVVAKTGIGEYMQFLVCAEDCDRHKPHAEPYIRAIQQLACDKHRCTIFEDSLSGYRSAEGVGGAGICVIVDDESSDSTWQANAYTISSYDRFDPACVGGSAPSPLDGAILESLRDLPALSVRVKQECLKAGFICDIRALSIATPAGSLDAVLKLSAEGNCLADTASHLGLYANEVLFYNQLAPDVGVSVPRAYSTFRAQGRYGIILEDLRTRTGTFGRDLDQDVDALLAVVKEAAGMHCRLHFKSEGQGKPAMAQLKTVAQITHYEELVFARFPAFLHMNRFLLSDASRATLTAIHDNFDSLLRRASCYPLSLCHGDLKSPNIFFEGRGHPVFLDWQYVHLNKGVSDIVFLLVESTAYDAATSDLVLGYYFNKTRLYGTHDEFMFDFRVALCVFPFFVMVWFNSIDKDGLLDTVFPIRFMKNVLQFYSRYLDRAFFEQLRALPE